MRRTPAFWFLVAVCLIVMGNLASPCKAQSATASSTVSPAGPTPLITQKLDESQLVTLPGTVHPLTKQATDEGAAADSLSLGRIMLVLNRSAAQQAALEQLLDNQQNPRSPSYHGWLTPGQFGQQFGAAPQDVQKITQWLESYGFAVEPPMAGRGLICFSGTHAQLRAALHTELHTFSLNGQTYYANVSDPQIPAALAPAIAGFASLNDFPRRALHTTPQLIKRVGSAWKQAGSIDGSAPQPQFTTTVNGQTLYAIGPYDLATIYNILPLWNSGIDGSGQTIAIVSDSDINPADVDSFRSTFGLPAKKLNLLYYGPDPGANSDESEADLDVEWAGAVAQGATIDLVVAGDTPTSGGIDGAAAYIVNNNLAPIMNVSYGACEYALGPAGNLFYSEIWQQAAAQGISVFVAAGDAGAAACDDHEAYAQYGLAVSGLASTPYNVAVGGTDLYGTYTAPTQYWNAGNNSTTLESAKSYIPEIPWNNSCASPEVLSALQAAGLTDKTPVAACNDASVEPSFLNTVGGSGGASSCVTGGASGVASCGSGYPKPDWQSGVSGIPSDGVRDLPDVSLMAGNGLWGSFYVYCQSDAIPGGACNVNTALEGAGGTSFASPIFAGLLALVEQKTASQQGNVNYALYKLAAAQYADSSLASACTSGNVAAGNACVFYDTTQGTIAVPCGAGTPNCTTTSGENYGILPGYNAAAGYDQATGLGTVNATNLVNAWNTAAASLLATTTTLTATGSTEVAYGTALNVNIAVAPSGSGTGTPSGLIGILSNTSTPNNAAVANLTLSGGQATGSLNTLIGGSYQLFAHYAGDATFAASESEGLSVTITPGAATASMSASRSTLQSSQKALVTLSLTGVSGGLAPTGTVTFTDTTNGTVLGSMQLTASTSGTAPVATAYITLAPSQMDGGANTITASYSGDTNYLPIASASVAVSLSESFTTSIAPSSLTLGPNGTGSVTVTATPSTSGTLNPATFSFSCPASLPAGLTCLFSAPAAAAGGAVASTLTVQLASPLIATPSHLAAVPPAGNLWLRAATAMACLLLFGIPARRRRMFLPLIAIACIALTFAPLGCGGGSKPAPIATTTTLSVSPSSPTLNSPVTLTANVVPASGTGTPTGTVIFSAGSTTLSTAPLSSGSATYNTSSLPIGSSSLTAAYSGDANYAASASSATGLDVSFTTSLTITGNDGSGDTSSASLAVAVQ